MASNLISKILLHSVLYASIRPDLSSRIRRWMFREGDRFWLCGSKSLPFRRVRIWRSPFCIPATNLFIPRTHAVSNLNVHSFISAFFLICFFVKHYSLPPPPPLQIKHRIKSPFIKLKENDSGLNFLYASLNNKSAECHITHKHCLQRFFACLEKFGAWKIGCDRRSEAGYGGMLVPAKKGGNERSHIRFIHILIIIIATAR